jgi:hypothetical protein
LHDILSKIQPELENRAAQRKAAGDLGDDGLGSTGFSLAYVDDVNDVLHHQDVDFVLGRFKFKVLGEPLGAVLNTEKTRIMTSTTGTSLVERLNRHHNRGRVLLGQQLESTISVFSTTKVNGLSVPVEVTDSLRALGAPVGSLKFCQVFLFKALSNSKAQSDADKLLSNIEDLQTTLRLHSMCTANKITHLFSHDVYNTTLDELPNQH